jgi:hypothetical protein
MRAYISAAMARPYYTERADLSLSADAKTLLWSVALGLSLELWCSTPARAQISPGPLSRAHQQWEGVTKCATCHDFGSGARGFKCLECHTEIQHRVAAHTGFHSQAFKNSPGETDCARCHMEHNGPTIALTRLDRNSFDHRAQTGFLLEGKHKEPSCQSCHTSKKIPVAARAEIKFKDVNKSFLGLGRTCTSCHEDPHGAQLGTECTRCHSQEAWKPAPGFNHARTAFALTGQHQTVACQKCHAPLAGETVLNFKGLSFASCVGCHKDPHRGAFQEVKAFRGACETCHNTSGWKAGAPSTGFNHGLTKFVLNGKHAATICAQCHKDSDFKWPIPHERCADCHQDPHKGQFATRAAGSDCSSCHNETSFKPALFTRETHQQSAFRLEEKHATADCEKCHSPQGKDAVYRTGKLTCPACHEDVHARDFAVAPYENKCNLCHTQSAFQPPTYSTAEHAKTKFALDGAHTRVACNDCHKPMAQMAGGVATTTVVATVAAVGADKNPPRQHHFASQACTSCHGDPHQTTLTCETCHSTSAWKDLRKFDHAGTKFLTEGPHNVACIKCHAAGAPPIVSAPAAAGALAIPGATVGPVFAKTPNQCFRCHTDVHDGQFMQGGRQEDCSTCHTLPRWNAADFDHERTQFPLDRIHVVVACAKCHKEQRTVNDKAVRVFRGTPAECVRCH